MDIQIKLTITVITPLSDGYWVFLDYSPASLILQPCPALVGMSVCPANLRVLYYRTTFISFAFLVPYIAVIPDEGLSEWIDRWPQSPVLVLNLRGGDEGHL